MFWEWCVVGLLLVRMTAASLLLKKKIIVFQNWTNDTVLSFINKLSYETRNIHFSLFLVNYNNPALKKTGLFKVVFKTLNPLKRQRLFVHSSQVN